MPLFDDPTRQTFDALMQVFPQGMPFVQFLCASEGALRQSVGV